MAVIPFSRIFVGSERSVAVSGSRVYVLNSTTGEVLAFHSNNSSTQEKSSSRGPIVAATVNEDFTYILTVGENKMMQLWELPQLKLVNERELPKRPTGLAFTKDSQTILVSDKFGDVFSYPFHYIPPATKPIRDEFSSHENPSDGQLVLGHASPLTAFLLSQDEKYIITADRDEHIRVSWYPEGYNIEMYCLGHRKYVSAIHIPTFAPDTLISGGGDTSLKIWNWMSGQCTDEIQIWTTVEPFVAVKSNKRRRGENEEDIEGAVTKKRKGKGKKSKRRGNKKGSHVEIEGEGREEGGDGNGESEGHEEEGDAILEAVEEKVLVVSKIGSLQRGDSKFVLFSAVGVTALFAFQFPTGSIEHFDFGHPVVDFTIDRDGRVWVSLDTALPMSDSEPSKDGQLVRVVQIDASDKVAEISLMPENQALLKNLNETCATADLSDKAFDFYADLKGMPKWSEPSVQTTADSERDTTESISGSTTPKTLTRRKEGRMKNKRNVLAKMQSMVQNEDAGLTPPRAKEKLGMVRPHADVEAADSEEERGAKRAKSLMETSENGDVEMNL